jgi:hypothetical protein
MQTQNDLNNPSLNNPDLNNHETRYQEAISILKHHRKQNLNIATRSYDRINKAATHVAIVVFIMMSYFLHSALLGGSADTTTHIFALFLSSVVTLVAYLMIREFHPLRAIGAQYWQASNEYKRQIKTLEKEMEIEEPSINHDAFFQKRKVLVASALTTADSLAGP